LGRDAHALRLHLRARQELLADLLTCLAAAIDLCQPVAEAGIVTAPLQ
jgi:hypothetical protein